MTRNKRQRKMVQVFVKVDGGKTSTMEVEMSDRVDDIVKRTPISDQDVYVTSGGRTLRRSDKLESCEVRDGSTVEIMSRMRGGGRHKDKKSKVEKKQGMKQEPLKNEGPAILESEKEAVIRMLEETEEYRKIVDDVSGGSDVDMEWKMRYWLSKLRERPGADILECGLRWAVEARRKGRDKQEEQRRQAKQGEKTEQEQSKQGKQVRFGEEQQLGKTGAENAGEPEVMDKTTEVRTGRGSTGLVRGGDERCRADETSKGKGKGNGGKGEHEGKGGGLGYNGKHPEMRERGGTGPNGAKHGGRWLTPPGHVGSRREMAEEKETRGMRWADFEDDEGKEEEEREQETEEAEEKKEQEEGARQREMTDERPPGLEEVESEPKTQGEEQRQVESKQEAQEKESGRAREQKRAQEAREDEESRAQEAREEERRVEEAHEEERRAQEARKKQKRAQEAREEERRAQEAREEAEESAGGARGAEESAGSARERRAQEEQSREKRKAQEEQEEEESRSPGRARWRRGDDNAREKR